MADVTVTVPDALVSRVFNALVSLYGPVPQGMNNLQFVKFCIAKKFLKESLHRGEEKALQTTFGSDRVTARTQREQDASGIS